MQGNNLMRLLYVGAFAVSGYASTEGRTCKPFNPLLGETYEADYPDKGLKFFSEKVWRDCHFLLFDNLLGVWWNCHICSRRDVSGTCASSLRNCRLDWTIIIWNPLFCGAGEPSPNDRGMSLRGSRMEILGRQQLEKQVLGSFYPGGPCWHPHTPIRWWWSFSMD